MSNKLYPFRHPLSVRIANLITRDIERLDCLLSGNTKPINWQSKFSKPFKAQYADWIMSTYTSREHINAVIAALPALEQHVVDYMASPRGKQGRPLQMFTDSTRHYINPLAPAPLQEGPANMLISPQPTFMPDIVRRPVITNEIPVPKLPAVRCDVPDDDDEMTDDEILRAVLADSRRSEPASTPATVRPDPAPGAAQADELARVLAGILAGAAPAPPLDEERVRAIARDVMQGYAAPLKVEVTLHASDRLDVISPAKIQHAQFPVLLKLCTLRGADGYTYPIWLPGPSGSGKTTAAHNAADALGLVFYHTGAVDNPYGLLGFLDANSNYHRTSFREAYEYGGVFLFDEVDASSPSALVALNAAIENGSCAFPDETVNRHPDCIIIAAANTYGAGATHEYVGRNKLDAATVDRFIMLDWQYDEGLESAIAQNDSWVAYVRKVRDAVAKLGIKHVVSPRASVRGAAMLAAGFDLADVQDAVVRKGLTKEQWASVKSRVG